MSYSLSQDELKALGRRHGASLTRLSVEIEYQDYPPELRITRDVSALFPSLTSMYFNCVNVAELDLKMPELQSLHLENAREVHRFRLDCPELERMNFDFVTIRDARDFAASVGRSPKLEALHAYKVMPMAYQWTRLCCSRLLLRCCWSWRRPQVIRAIRVINTLHSLQAHFKSTLKQSTLIKPSRPIESMTYAPSGRVIFDGYPCMSTTDE